MNQKFQFGVLILVISICLTRARGVDVSGEASSIAGKDVYLCLYQCPTSWWQWCWNYYNDGGAPKHCPQTVNVGPGESPPSCDEGGFATYKSESYMMNVEKCQPYNCMQFGPQSPESFPPFDIYNVTNLCGNNNQSLSLGKLTVPSAEIRTRPVFKAYFGQNELMEPHTTTPAAFSASEFQWKDHRGVAAVQHFHTHIASHGVISFQYKMRHTSRAGVYSLDAHAAVVGVTCFSGGIMTVNFDSMQARNAAAAQISAGDFVIGGREWKCNNHPTSTRTAGSVLVIHRRITRLSSPIFKADLTLHTEPAKLTELFEYVDTAFSVSAFPPDHISQHVLHGSHAIQSFHKSTASNVFEATVSNLSENNSAGCWFCLSAIADAAKWAWGGVVGLGNAVKNSIERIPTLLKVLVTGDYDYKQSFTLGRISWNFDGDTKQALNSSIPLSENISCSNCFVNMDASLNFALKIQDWSLDFVSLWAEGQATVSIASESTLSISSATNKTMVLGLIKLDPVCFTVGAIPFCIDTTIPVSSQIQVSAGASISNSVNITGNGKFKYGVLFQPGTNNDGLHWINENGMLYSGAPAKIAAEAYFSVIISILPTIVFSIDHVGGPNVGLKLYTEFAAVYKTTNSVCSADKKGPGLQVQLNAGLQVSVGAHLELVALGHTLVNHTWDPVGVLSLKFPIFSKCLNQLEMQTTALIQTGHPYNAVLLEPHHVLNFSSTPFFELSTFVGEMQPTGSCPGAPAAKITLQYITAEADWVMSIGWNHVMTNSSTGDVYNIWCVAQASYEDGLPPTQQPPHPLQFFFNQKEDPVINYPVCQEVNYDALGISGMATFTAGYSILSLQVGMSCYEDTIQLVAQA